MLSIEKAVAKLDQDKSYDRFILIESGTPKILWGTIKHDYVCIPSGWQPLRGRSLSSSMQGYRSQRFYWPLEPHVDEIDFRDIALGLSRQIRFIGQTNHPYNVAWHSYALSHVVPEHLQKWALIHDCAESFLPDIIRPLKQLSLFDEYNAIEHKVMSVIAEAFGMESLEQPEELYYYDTLMGTIELYYQMGDIGIAKLRAIGHTDFLNTDEIESWMEWITNVPTMEQSEVLWLKRFNQLFGIVDNAEVYNTYKG